MRLIVSVWILGPVVPVCCAFAVPGKPKRKPVESRESSPISGARWLL
jgi:hypothetical protein